MIRLVRAPAQEVHRSTNLNRQQIAAGLLAEDMPYPSPQAMALLSIPNLNTSQIHDALELPI